MLDDRFASLDCRVVRMHPGYFATEETRRVALAMMQPPGSARIATLDALHGVRFAPNFELDLVELWADCDAWMQARRQHPLAQLSANPVTGDRDLCVWEVSAALRLSENTTRERIHLAEELTGRLTHTLRALERAAITLWQAKAIAEGLLALGDADAAAAEERILRRAPELSLTDTRKMIARIVMEIDPQAAEERRKERRKQRRVERPTPTWDGTSGVWIEGPTEQMAGFYLILTALGQRLKATGAVDTVDQGRFDALMALVFAAAYANTAPDPDGSGPPTVPPVPAHVDLLVNATTLAGLDNLPAEIPGYGPITAQTARRIIFGHTDDDDGDDDDGDDPGGGPGPHPPTNPGPSPSPPPAAASAVSWKLLPIDPATGWLVRPDDPDLDRGRSTRFATPKQRGYLADRDRVCTHPHCNQPARRNDVDHRPGWINGARTDVDEMGSECPHHNRTTDTAGWTKTIGPNGTATLTSALGRQYPMTPWRYWDV